MAVMFKQLAFSIIFSQLASLIVTFLLLPMFSSRIKDTNSKTKLLGFVLKPFDKLMKKVYSLYEILLVWCLHNRKKVMGVIAVTLVVSLLVLSQLGMTLMPASDEGVLSVSIELPQGASLEDSDAISKKAESLIKENESVKDVFSTVGSGGTTSMLGGTTSNMSTITVTLNEKRNKTNLTLR